MELSSVYLTLLTFFMITSVVFISLFGVYFPQTSSSGMSSVPSQQIASGYPRAPGNHLSMTYKSEIRVPDVDNPFEKIDHVYYINLDERKDRNYQVEQELQRMHIDPRKMERIPGVKGGPLGRSQAHLNALLDCKKKGYRNCLIVEDDVKFKGNRQSTYEQLRRLWSLGIPWDVIIFAGCTTGFVKTDCSFVIRVNGSHTTSSYLVNGSYLDTMLNNIQEGIQKLSDSNQVAYFIDRYWNSLQKLGRWFAFHPIIAHQQDGYSDIQKQLVSYDDKKEVIDAITKYTYFICIKTCLSLWRKNPKQIEALEEIVERSKGEIQYLFYYGDETIPTSYQYDVTLKTLIVQSKDDYLNLCHKVGLMFTFLHDVTSIEPSFQDIRGFFFTDDDITIFPEKFCDFLIEKEPLGYWGNVGLSGEMSGHLKLKSRENPRIHKLLSEQYPILLTADVGMPAGVEFCAGGGFFLKTAYVHDLSQMEDYFTPFPSPNQLFFHLSKSGVIENVHVFDDIEIGVAMKALGVTPEDATVSKIVKW